MATDLNITMKQYNGVDYDTLYPKTIIEQVDGLSDSYFTKNQTLTSSTANQFGLGSNAVPDDVLSFLGQYNEYWWKRIAADTTEYVHSTNRNAYPDSGEVEGVTYEYLGIPLEQTPGIPLRAKIETGSYTGSGATTKTLTFSFKPMAVFVGIATDNRFLSPMVYGQGEAVGTNTGNGRYGLSLTWSDNSLTIASDDDDRGADYFNFSGKEHTYVAIG